MEKTLLLVASFGTTHQDTCGKNIGAVELHLTETFPECVVRRAFTSTIVRKVLAKCGSRVDDVPTALQQAKAEGFDRVVIQPTHLLYGEEYEKLCAQAAEFSGCFGRLAVAKPLLAQTRDLLAVTQTLANAFPMREKMALVLMGHGSEHYVNPVYAAMQTAFRLAGRADVFVGTVEAWPGIDEVAAQLAAGRYQKAALVPLMLVAGDHAENDMAGDDADSWKSSLQRQGVMVETVLRGLGEYAAIRELYAMHTREAMDAAAV